MPPSILRLSGRIHRIIKLCCWTCSVVKVVFFTTERALSWIIKAGSLHNVIGNKSISPKCSISEQHWIKDTLISIIGTQFYRESYQRQISTESSHNNQCGFYDVLQQNQAIMWKCRERWRHWTRNILHIITKNVLSFRYYKLNKTYHFIEI